ncbi:hypothetical protein ACJJTC_011358 [Scirpophaga incertulas]
MDIIDETRWSADTNEPEFYFMDEKELDNSVVEKILRNRFIDPNLSSSESEDEATRPKLDWDKIFKKNKHAKDHRYIVQGIHPPLRYKKLSALTSIQHVQCLTVLCSQNPEVIPDLHIPRPTRLDYKVFEEVKETYAKEQKEFLEWAKFLWANSHCVRALRPKPIVETVYEAEFNIKAKEMECFPKLYTLAAQIPLESATSKCEIVHQKELVKVSIASLPQMQHPDMSKRITITRSYPTPMPCNKHPTRFVLPTDTKVTQLPLTEVHNELAQFAFDNGASNIASESALRCLVQESRYWTLPVSVCRAISNDGAVHNVVVLGSEFAMGREVATVRTYKAYRRLLQHALLTPCESVSEFDLDASEDLHQPHEEEDEESMEESCVVSQDLDMTLSDDDEDGLIIDTDLFEENKSERSILMSPKSSGSAKDDLEMNQSPPSPIHERVTRQSSRDAEGNISDLFKCVCKDTRHEKPAARSYRRLRVRSYHECHDLVVHAAHRLKDDNGEVILEPIPEYQLDCGASEQTPDQIRSVALALLLRKNASVLNVRIDTGSGDIVHTERVPPQELNKRLLEVVDNIANRLHTALAQLQGLVPGRYLLCHQNLWKPTKPRT